MAILFEGVLWLMLIGGVGSVLAGYVRLRRTAARIRETRPTLQLTMSPAPNARFGITDRDPI